MSREGALVVAKALKPSQGDILALNKMGGGRVRRVSAKSLRASASQLDAPAAAGALPPSLRRGSTSAAGSVDSPLASGRRLSGMSVLDGYATTSISASHISSDGTAPGQPPTCGGWGQEPQQPRAGSLTGEQPGRRSGCASAAAIGEAAPRADSAAAPGSLELQWEEDRVRVELHLTAAAHHQEAGDARGQQLQECSEPGATAACSAQLVRLRLHTGAAASSAAPAAPAAAHAAAAAAAETGEGDDAAPRQQTTAAASGCAACGSRQQQQQDAAGPSAAAHTGGYTGKSRTEPRAAARRGEERTGAPSAGPSRAGSVWLADGLPSPAAARTHRSVQQDKEPQAAAQQSIIRCTMAEGIKEIRSVYGVGARQHRVAKISRARQRA